MRSITEHASYVVGVIGADIGPSFSPSLHEREAAELGLRYVYERRDIHELGLAPEGVGEHLRAAQRLRCSGVNVTHPCKQTVVEHLTELSSDGAALGAVNTVVFDHGNAVGHNTDWPGSQQSVVRGLPDVEMNRVALLGAGGAGAAVAHAALSLGVERRPGCRTLDGGGMAVFQAALSFALFTGHKPDHERMLRHFARLAEDAPAAAMRSG